MWAEKEKQPIRSNRLAWVIMVTDFVAECSDLLRLTEEFERSKLICLDSKKKEQ